MKSTLYCITNAFIILGDMKPNSEIVIARALFVNIVLNANASVASKIIIGSCVNISIPIYVNIFNISNLNDELNGFYAFGICNSNVVAIKGTDEYINITKQIPRSIILIIFFIFFLSLYM